MTGGTSGGAPDYAGDLLARRRLIETAANPDAKIDYVATLEAELAAPGGGRARVVVRYVPDRRVMTAASLRPYLQVVGELPPESLEQAATLLIGDLADQLVPRWVQVFVQQRADGPNAGLGRHEVLVEERQPRWKNDELLRRLAPL